jgi:hypothetical protein
MGVIFMRLLLIMKQTRSKIDIRLIIRLEVSVSYEDRFM